MIAFMKKFLVSCLLIAAAIFSLLTPAGAPRPSAAEGDRFAVAETDGVWFYSEKDEASGIFLLPVSYYVKITEQGEPFCAVEYGDGVTLPKLKGYCKTEKLKSVSFTPARPYLVKQVTLTYTLEGSLFDEFDSLEKTFLYYGSTFRGTARYWYVCADGKYGYVSANEEPEYERNVDYLTSDVSGEVNPPERAQGLSGVQIALICVALFAAAAVAAVVFFARRSPAPRREEDDFV